MEILISPTAFKGSLTAGRAASVMVEAIQEISNGHELIEKPVADGGDGTLNALVHATGGRTVEKKVEGPLGRDVHAEFGILGDSRTAIVEMARASGLTLLSRDEYDPLHTTTAGTGELIRAAIEEGCDHVIVGIGGSATVDGGTGMARKLGYRFLDENGDEVTGGGGALHRIHRIETDEVMPALRETTITCACDVRNPLIGENGAARVYGPQKGASPEDVEVLEENLASFQNLLREELDRDVSDLEGAGAAGGLGAGLFAFLDAELRPGVEIVFDKLNLESSVNRADLVLTGEGALDASSLEGKAAVSVARLAKKHGTPCLLFSGRIPVSSSPEYSSFYQEGVTALFSVAHGPSTLDECRENADELLRGTVQNVIRLFSNETGLH